MKKYIAIPVLMLVLALGACTKQQFADSYTNPSSVASTTVEQQFAGFLTSNLNWVMYHYWDYFVDYQNTLIPWSQTAATINTNGRYIPGAGAVNDIWSGYYAFVAQYKELLRINASLSAADQQAKRIYIIAATIYYYDYTQKMIDLWGDIPWSQAGLLSSNGGDYAASVAKYDDAATIYTKMLDDLKGFADELNTLTISPAVAQVIKTQDFLTHGNLTTWKKYCNSLRVKLLTRVNGVTAFQSRVNSEMAAITGSAANYPLVVTNADNIAFAVNNNTSGPVNNGTGTGANADFYRGIIGWGGGDIASKLMIDTMNNNADPRLRAMFEAGTANPGVYVGMDPSLASTAQQAQSYMLTLARYNRSTITQNVFLPGMLINAAEINFHLAEYYLNSSNNASAKTAYEAGITQSINYTYYVRTLSNNSIAGALTPLGANEISNYLASNIAWSNATTSAQKLNLIATQKWINYNILQPMECWAEIRRLKLPALNFVQDAGVQKLPPTRWLYASNESTYNAANYQTVSSKDNLSTKIFWDVK